MSFTQEDVDFLRDLRAEARECGFKTNTQGERTKLTAPDGQVLWFDTADELEDFLDGLD